MTASRRCRPPSGPGGRYTYADVDMGRVREAMAAAGRCHRALGATPSMPVVDEVATRAWHLEGWVGKERVHRSICYGDPALDTAMHGLEARHRGVRIKVWLA